MALQTSPPRLTPGGVLRLIVVAALGALALGSLITLVVVGAGKLGLELMPTVEMRLFIATTAWPSLVGWLITVLGFGGSAALLIRKAPGAVWAWVAGFISAALTQIVESATAARSGAEVDPSGFGVLAILAVLGWGVFILEHGPRRPRLPPGASRR